MSRASSACVKYIGRRSRFMQALAHGVGMTLSGVDPTWER